MLKWKSSAKPEIILERIQACRTLQSDGIHYSFESWPLDQNAPILETMLDFPEEILRDDWPSIVWKGISGVVGDLTKDSFIQSAKKAISVYGAKPNTRYDLLTTISIRKDTLPKNFSYDGCSVKFYREDFPKKYQSRSNLFNITPELVVEVPYNYARVVVQVVDKTAEKAFEQASRKLDVVRSIWNLLYNHIGSTQIGGKLRPINRIRLGSTHTVHMPAGEPASEQYWYEPNFSPTDPFIVENQDRFQSEVKNWLKFLAKSTYSDRITRALVLSVRALDEPDPNTSFIRLWTALEHLTSSEQADHQAIIRRCSFLSPDPERAALLLNHLRHYRNSSVHNGNQSTYAKRETYLLLNIFRDLVQFHLGTGSLFGSFAETNEMLDLSPNIDVLRKKLILIQRGIKYRTPRLSVTNRFTAP
ncbi:hypothetical protein ACO0LO_07925 [Undibacterium sp. TJN25]|uniref:hypothetical protein n=1 Tax=Undibacterium sp. TJN25 TaxID=3413056 RepID=UPI003BF050BB